SEKEPKWYNNGTFSPALSESKRALKDLVTEEVNFILNELHTTRGYTFIGSPVVSFDFDPVTVPTDLNLDSLTVQVSGIRVVNELKDAQENSNRSENDINVSQKFEYPVWKLYNHFTMWATNDSGGFTQKLKDAFNSAQWFSSICKCGGATNPQNQAQKITISWSQIDSIALKPAVTNLQQIMGSEFECTYVVDQNKLENIPNIYSTSTLGCDAACSGGVLSTNASILGADLVGWPLSDVGYNGSYRGILEYDTIADPQEEIPRQLTNQANNGIGTIADPINPGRIVTTTGDGFFEGQGVIRKAAGLIIVTCSDPTLRIPAKDAFRSLSASVYLRFAVHKSSDPPNACPGAAPGLSPGGETGCLIPGAGGPPANATCKINKNCAGPLPGTFVQGNPVSCDVCQCFSGSTVIKSTELDQWCCDGSHPELCINNVCGSDLNYQAACQQHAPLSGTTKPALACASSNSIYLNNPTSNCAANKLSSDATCLSNICVLVSDGGVVTASNDCGVKPKGLACANQGCKTCEDGRCTVRESPETFKCSTDALGCRTFCASDGRCAAPSDDLGKGCPNLPAGYKCRTCERSTNGLLQCQSIGTTCTAGNGCCEGVVYSPGSTVPTWGACTITQGQCCPVTKQLSVCPPPR
ncbi:MAG: hypothetical protein Q7R47_06275, partial [Candidatus Diapherotrites archaeon]|nr:hypothetical protein [Candidatus Diapherotrites archaeon]